MKNVNDWAAKIRNKDWSHVFDKLHIYTVRLLMSATVISGLWMVYAGYKWKEEFDFRQQVEDYKNEEESRRAHVEEGSRDEIKDTASEQKDTAKRYSF